MNLCAKSELCIFDRPAAQVVVENGVFEEIYPVNSISNSKSDLEFLITGSQTEYLDLNDTLLAIEMKVVDQHGKDLAADADVYASQYMFHTLFHDVVLSLNGIKVEGGNGKYTSKALIETIINYNTDSKATTMAPMGYLNKDERKALVAKSKKFTLCSSLQLDFFDQPKYLISGVNVHIRLLRNRGSSCLMSLKDEPKVTLLNAKLLVRRVRLEQSVLIGHQIGLNKSNACYPFRLKEVVNYNIPIGSTSFYKENLFGDRQIPLFVLVAFQTNDRHNGSYKKELSEFDHLNVNSLTLSKGTDYREKYAQDFENDSFTTSYMQSIVRNMGHLDKNLNCGIELSEFKSQTPFFTFVLAPDFDINQNQLPQHGNLRLDVKFTKALTEAAYCIVYGVFEKELQITSNRSVLV